MNSLEAFWKAYVDPDLLPTAFIVGAAGWGLLALLWAYQARLAARGTRWPAMYIHLLKTAGAASFAVFFVLSLIWHEDTPPVTRGAYLRNLFNGVIVFVLFVAAIWRIKETVKKDARAAVVQDVPYLREAP